MSNKLKKAISLLLAAIMCLGLLPAMAFAEEAPQQETPISWTLPEMTDVPIRLLCIGDSTSNGYFLEGYTDNNQGIGSESGTNCYPQKLYRDLCDIYGEENVIFSQYCMNSTRWNELRMLLEESFNKKENPCYVDSFDRMDSYVSSFNDARNTGVDYLGDPVLLSTSDWYHVFADSVKNADIITIDLGMNNFGTYVCQRLMANLGMQTAIGSGNYPENLQDIAEQLNSVYGSGTTTRIRAMEGSILEAMNSAYNDAAKVALNDANATITDFLTSIDKLGAADARAAMSNFAAGMAEQNPMGWMLFDVVETVTYSFGCVLLNYDKSMEYIYEANPDAMVIIDGLYNGMKDMVAVMPDGTTFQFGELWGGLLNNINGFLSGEDETYAKNRWTDKIRFNADATNLTIFVDEVKNFSGNPMTDYNKNSFDRGNLNRIIDLVYRLNDNMPNAPDLTQVISNALMQGIQTATEANVLSSLRGNSTLRTFGLNANEVAARVAANVVEGIKKNCCANGEYLTAEDVKAAYAKNTIAEFSLNVSEVSGKVTMRVLGNLFAAIFDRNYTRNAILEEIDKLSMDATNSNFAVAAGFEVIRKNMVKAAALTDVNLGDLFTALGRGDLAEAVAPALIDFDNAGSAAQALLHICVRFIGLRGFGTHPDAAGAAMKYDTIKKQMPETALTIHYQNADGSMLAEDYTQKLPMGEKYSITSPTVENYAPDQTVVTGKASATVTVTYTATHTLTINYVDSNNNPLADPFTAQIVEDSEYSQISPTIAHYTTNTLTVSGTMGTEDVTVTVIYEEVPEAECVLSRKVDLSEGTHHLYLNGRDMGEFTFAKSGNKWSIQNGDGKYLTVQNGRLAYNNSADACWTYQNNAFTVSVQTATRSSYNPFGWPFGGFGYSAPQTTTYYLTTSGNALSVSTSAATAAVYDVTSMGNHEAGECVHENEKVATCKEAGSYDEVYYCQHCGEELSRSHVVTEVTDVHTPGRAKTENIDGVNYTVTRCTVCGKILEQTEIPTGEITANVTVSSSVTYFLFIPTRVYNVQINASSSVPGVRISKVQYSTNGYNWSTGSRFSSASRPGTIYVRVTDSVGTVTNFTYSNGTTVKD